ncbi:MAG TPA: hypothetical protein VGM56_27100 [Byssovorax sp.]|jgi:hypothetical protein
MSGGANKWNNFIVDDDSSRWLERQEEKEARKLENREQLSAARHRTTRITLLGRRHPFS